VCHGSPREFKRIKAPTPTGFFGALGEICM